GDARPDDADHRAPPLHHLPRRRDRRARRGPDRRARHARRAARDKPGVPRHLRARLARAPVRGRRRGTRRSGGGRLMRVWQPGGHLMADRTAKVDDWSWRRTRRRLATLARLATPYKLRTIL